jgi:hypothetical protein
MYVVPRDRAIDYGTMEGVGRQSTVKRKVRRSAGYSGCHLRSAIQS